MSEILGALRGAGPWAAFLLLGFMIVMANLRGWLVTRREFNAAKAIWAEQLAQMTEQRNEYRVLVNAQLAIDRRRIQVLDDALEGSRVVTQVLRKIEPPREIGPAA